MIEVIFIIQAIILCAFVFILIGMILNELSFKKQLKKLKNKLKKKMCKDEEVKLNENSNDTFAPYASKFSETSDSF